MRGFTLVELLCALGLTFVLLGAAGVGFRQGADTVTAAEAQMDMLAQARSASERIEADLLGRAGAARSWPGPFRTLTHGGGEAGAVDVSYRLEPLERGRRSGRMLYALVRRAVRPRSGAVEEEVSRHVLSLDVEEKNSCARVALRVADGPAERSEQHVVRTVWIPVRAP